MNFIPDVTIETIVVFISAIAIVRELRRISLNIEQLHQDKARANDSHEIDLNSRLNEIQTMKFSPIRNLRRINSNE